MKVFYEPQELDALLDAQGWHAGIEGTRWFIYGHCQPG